MKKLFATLLFIAASCVAASAQTEQPRPSPTPLDEFGYINISDMLARLDNFAIELQNSPQSRGFIVAYPQLNQFPGWALRRAYWGKGYLVQSRGLDSERVVVVNGGFRDENKFQLWVVTDGAQSPVASFDLAAELMREKTPYLFDRVFVYERSPGVPEVEEYDYLNEKDAYEPFVTTLRSDPSARGLIIAYATRRSRRGEDRRLATRKKLAVLKAHSIGADRIVAKGGGLREKKTVEFWIVPPGAELPKPTPDARPKRRKRH